MPPASWCGCGSGKKPAGQRFLFLISSGDIAASLSQVVPLRQLDAHAFLHRLAARHLRRPWPGGRPGRSGFEQVLLPLGELWLFALRALDEASKSSCATPTLAKPQMNNDAARTRRPVELGFHGLLLVAMFAGTTNRASHAAWNGASISIIIIDTSFGVRRLAAAFFFKPLWMGR